MSEQIIEQLTFDFEPRKTIKGYPELHWTGKRPYKSTIYYPAQLKESYGTDKDGWFNKIFWGDNLQVMSHLLKDYRGKIDLIYIDPPFDSKADYKKKIKLKSKEVSTDQSSFEEKQYGDIWNNDEYLQFMYERLVLMRELLSDKGSIYLHCDWHKNHHLRMIMDEIFGVNFFRNEIVWCYDKWVAPSRDFQKNHDIILKYSKTDSFTSNTIREIDEKRQITLDRGYTTNLLANGEKQLIVYKGQENKPNIQKLMKSDKFVRVIIREPEGNPIKDWWQINILHPKALERLDYPTQKPEKLIERIILASSNPGDIVFDCFMGSGTTQAVAMKLGRRFIGADINLGAIQTTTKRLINVSNELNNSLDNNFYTGFEVYNVNNYDLFRNPLEAKELIMQALEVQPFDAGNVYDGEKDGRMIKVMPVNRIATKADLQGLISNLPYKTFEKIKEDSPTSTVLKLTLVCMGHEPDLAGALAQELNAYKVDIEVVDILHDKTELQFKRDAEANVVIENGEIVIKNFYPLNLMQKLSVDKDMVDNKINIEDWKQLVESVMIDFNYDGAVMQPTLIDIPDKNDLVVGKYKIPQDAGKIRIKITDLLSESLEIEVQNG